MCRNRKFVEQKHSSHLSYCRSSHQRCSIEKGVLRNFTKFTGERLCQSLFFNKVAGLHPWKRQKTRFSDVFRKCSPATLLKTRFWYRCFPVNFVKFLRTSFFIEHFWWLFLYLIWHRLTCSTILQIYRLHLKKKIFALFSNCRFPFNSKL